MSSQNSFSACPYCDSRTDFISDDDNRVKTDITTTQADFFAVFDSFSDDFVVFSAHRKRVSAVSKSLHLSLEYVQRIELERLKLVLPIKYTSEPLINSCKIIEKKQNYFTTPRLAPSDYMRFISKIYNQIILILILRLFLSSLRSWSLSFIRAFIFKQYPIVQTGRQLFGLENSISA